MKKSLLVLFATIVASIGLQAQVIFKVMTPASLAGNYTMSLATTGWGGPDMNIASNAVEDLLVFVGADSLACTPPTNGAELTGKIAVLYRGSCEFGAKALAAQNAGAIAVIIINNQGAPIAMGAGASGANVTVPVIMISTEDGAKLRSEIKAGNVRGFIGTKAGLYATDLGYKTDMTQYAEQAARPLALSTAAGEFTVKPGLWVYNFGNTAQSGASAVATIKKGTSTVYTQTVGNITLASGDSVFVTFPDYAPAFSDYWEYTLSYSVNPATTDEYLDDNTKNAKFSTNHGAISYARLEPTTGLPVANNFVKSTSAAPVFYCMSFREPNASRLQLKGFSFATTPQAPHKLTNEYMEIEMYAWNDAFNNLDEEATFDNLEPVAFAEYTYSANLDNQTVFVPFNDQLTLVDNQRYLTCVKVLTDSIFFGFNNELDYSQNINTLYKQPVSPIQSGGTWYSGGFGAASASAIGVHFENPAPISTSIREFALNAEGSAYPTPSADFVNIPFKSEGAKSATIQIMDMTGKVVATTTAVVEASKLTVNTTTLATGSYLFNVTLDNGKSSAFRVMVGR